MSLEIADFSDGKQDSSFLVVKTTWTLANFRKLLSKFWFWYPISCYKLPLVFYLWSIILLVLSAAAAFLHNQHWGLHILWWLSWWTPLTIQGLALTLDDFAQGVCRHVCGRFFGVLICLPLRSISSIALSNCSQLDVLLKLLCAVHGARYYIDSIVRYINISILDTDTFFVSDTSITIPILDLDLSQFLTETILEILNSDTLSVFARSVIVIFTLNSLISPFQFSP